MPCADESTGTRDALEQLARIAGEYLEQESDGGPLEPISHDRARAALPIDLPDEGVGGEEALERLRRIVLATPTTAGPRFVNQLFAGREPVAVVAEMLTALMNNSMYTYKAAGPMVLVEREVMERMLGKAGMGGGGGMFAPGGSMSNLAAMIAGRNEVCGLSRDEGFDGRRKTLYFSSEGHYSITKNAMMIGLGREHVRAVEADELGAMRPEALAAAIEADRAEGLEPMMVVATSGTTVMGAFDPLDALADVCEREGLWLHVDGAYGGSALMHPEHREKMEGIERADSFTWDAHKVMGVPLTCSVCLTRDPELMPKHFNETADYLFQQDFDEDASWMTPGVRSLQCGRRNDALKLWALWQALGDDGFASRVGRQVALARHAAAVVRADDRLRLCFEPGWLAVCFEVIGKSSVDICSQLNQSGTLKVGYGLVHGRRVIRLVTLNPEHDEADLDRMIRDIAEVGDALPDRGDEVNIPPGAPLDAKA
ncbi:MAG: pyridoxal phosphate-dependent decarboxylase family protein [Phycisphaerales bacterium JB040]